MNGGRTWWSVEDLIQLLHACRKEKNLDRAFRLHSYIYSHGLEAHTLLGNCLVASYGGAGAMDCAQSVFDKLTYCNESSWNSIIIGYVKLGKPQNALLLYDKMHREGYVGLNSYAFVALLKASVQLNDFERGLLLSMHIEREGLLEKNCFVGSALLDMFFKCGSIIRAQEVFEKLLDRDVVSWNAMISGLAKYGYADLALKCFQCMKVECVSPNDVTFLSVLKACGAICAIEEGTDAHVEIERMGLLETCAAIGSALVNMYSKCGCLVKAQGVFDRLAERDVISWTALITGYAEYRHYGKVIVCFLEMQIEGVPPDIVTLACSLRACGSLRSVERGIYIHQMIKRNGILERNPSIGSSLVDMYAKCGMLDKAQRLFDELSAHDVDSWNSLVLGYAENGHDEEALNCFEQMQLEGISPDAVTVLCCIKVCGSSGNIGKMSQIHDAIKRCSELENDVVIANSLVDAYAKCGLPGKAQEIFDKLAVRDVVSWNVLIMGYVENGCSEEALKCFEWMQMEGMSPDVTTYVCVCKACGSIGDMQKSEEMHIDIERKGFLSNALVLGNVLIDMYLQCGELARAHQVFRNLSRRDIVSWNTLVAGYTEHGYDKEALKLCEQMGQENILPNALTFLCVIKACANLGFIEKGQEIHAEIKRNDLGNDAVIGTALVNMYANCSLLHEARQVFDQISVHDVTTWNVMMHGYDKCGHGEQTLQCFEQMQLKCITPNTISFVYALKACGVEGDVENGKKVHAEIARRGLLETDLIVGNTLIDMYAKCGLFGNAQEVFDKLQGKDVISWTTLIAGYVDCGHGEEALEYFKRMQLDGVLPNSITYLCSLRACGSLGATNQGQEIHAEIERKGMIINNDTITITLVDMYAKCGLVSVAQQVFDRLPNPGLVAWNALIAGYAQAGESAHVWQTFDRMLEKGMEPDPVTFLIVMNACSRAGWLSRYQMYFDVMSTRYGFAPTTEHQNCMLDLLVRNGEIEKAVCMLQKKPYCASPATWHTLLEACKKWGNVELGMEAFEHARSIDESDGAAYALVSQIYANNGSLP